MKRYWPFAIPVVLLFFPLAVHSPYVLHLFIVLFTSVALGAAWNLIGGFGGQYSVGHAAFYGVGAYATLILMGHAIAPWWGGAASIVLSAIAAVIIGLICFRLRGPYFVLASIAVAEILRIAALSAKSLTNGAEGILASDIRPLTIFGWEVTTWASKEPYFVLALLLATACVAINGIVLNRRLGYWLQAIREDQDAANSLGIQLNRYKTIALVLSAALTALAGEFYALYVGFIDPNTVLGLELSVQVVLICIIGGVGTLWGPVLGALLLVPLSEALRANLISEGLFRIHVLDRTSAAGAFISENLAHGHLLIYGILVIVVILFMPDGLVGLFRRRRHAT
jgi:branched-chain amino acid transport system permease protein